MEKNHVEEIDLDPKIGELPEALKKSLPKFFLDDLPFTQEEYFNAIEWHTKGRLPATTRQVQR
jgi:hypothetical protein